MTNAEKYVIVPRYIFFIAHFTQYRIFADFDKKNHGPGP
jgi:hypothetical protein